MFYQKFRILMECFRTNFPSLLHHAIAKLALFKLITSKPWISIRPVEVPQWPWSRVKSPRVSGTTVRVAWRCYEDNIKFFVIDGFVFLLVFITSVFCVFCRVLCCVEAPVLARRTFMPTSPRLVRALLLASCFASGILWPRTSSTLLYGPAAFF